MTGDWVWQEYPARLPVNSGHTTIEVDLTGNWGSEPINDLTKVVYIGIFLYPTVNGESVVFLDNVRVQ